MIELNLTANCNEQSAIKEFLQNNASVTLAQKINNGVRTIKDGRPFINKKNLDGFMKYACDEAKKLAEQGAKFACIHSDTVFNWAIHYFEEDSIEGVLYNEDGTEFKPPKTKYEPKATTVPVTPSKQQCNPQPTLFDLIEKPKESIESTDSENEEDYFTEEVMQEIFKAISEQEAEENEINLQGKIEPQKGSPLYQQYMKLQQLYPDSIIAMRLGDFYEVFGDGATTLAKELNLTLTGRDCGIDSRVPMVGFPYHISDNYFKKICEKYNLVIAENTEDVKILGVRNSQNEYIDYETGEYLTEEEMREFDGDIEEPKEFDKNFYIDKSTTTAPTATIDNKILIKLSELFGNILTLR